MRLIVTGVKDGKSCLVKEVDCTPQAGGFSTVPTADLDLAVLSPRPPGHSAFADLQVPPGKMVWLRVNFAPNEEHGFHYTDTIDCHTIVAGAMDLLLDDGPHRLNAGDCAMVTGVDHGWRVGPEGCVSSLQIFGTPKPE